MVGSWCVCIEVWWACKFSSSVVTDEDGRAQVYTREREAATPLAMWGFHRAALRLANPSPTPSAPAHVLRRARRRPEVARAARACFPPCAHDGREPRRARPSQGRPSAPTVLAGLGHRRRCVLLPRRTFDGRESWSSSRGWRSVDTELWALATLDWSSEYVAVPLVAGAARDSVRHLFASWGEFQS